MMANPIVLLYDYDPKELYYLISDLDSFVYGLLPIEILNLVTIEIDLFFSMKKQSLSFSKVEESTGNSQLENYFIETIEFNIEFIKKLLVSNKWIDYEIKDKIRDAVVNKYNNIKKDF